MNQKQQSGFTLIELVMVIAILGILAATALPKFIDLQKEAQQASVDGVAGALGAASAINKAASVTKPAGSAQAVNNCSDAPLLLEGGVLDSKFAITASPITPPATATCTVTVVGTTPAVTATFTLHGV